MAIATFTNTTINTCTLPFAIYDGSSTWYAFPSSIVEASLEDYKLWSDGSGRSMTGESKGTMVGIFPKLQAKIGKQNADDRATLCALLNKSAVTVRAYSVDRKRFENASFYFGDVVNKIKRWDSGGSFENGIYISDTTFEPISFSIISNKRRSNT